MSGRPDRRPPGDGERGRPSRAPTAPEEEGGDGTDRLDFAVTTRRFLQDQINLADSKAGAVSTVSVLLLAYVVRVGSETNGLGGLPTAAPETWLLLGGVLSLGIGIAAALSVVVPRLVGDRDGLVFWQAILRLGSAEDYAEAVVRSGREVIVAALLKDCHQLSRVCERKYSALRWAMSAAGIGLALSLVWLLLY